MPVIRNSSFQTLDFQDGAFMYGTGTLVPDAGGGLFGIVVPGLSNTRCHLVACYGDFALFTPANAGILRVSYDEPSSSIIIVSTNVADNNPVRWFALR